MPTWSTTADLLEKVTMMLRAQWKAELPPFDSLPSQVLEAAVDAWCYVLAGDLTEPIDPPPEVRPWIVARVLSMAASARSLAEQGYDDAPELSPKTMRQFLIGEWHGSLRDRWQLMMDVGDGS